MKSKIWISFSKLILNLVFIYLVTIAIELLSQNLNIYIPFEFTYLIILILYFIFSHILKLNTIGKWLFSLVPKYQNYLSIFIIILVIMYLGNEFLKFKEFMIFRVNIQNTQVQNLIITTEIQVN